MKAKRLILGLVLIILVAAVAIILARPQTPTPAPTAQTPAPTPTPTWDPQNPGFVTGTIATIGSDQIAVASGPVTYTVHITASTQFVSQNSQGKLTPVALSDLQTGEDVTVLYSGPAPADNVYQADKIQVMDNNQ